MKTILLFIALTSSAFALDTLSRAEQHRLGAYLSYIVSSLEESEQAEVYKAGDTCPSCGGRGKQGDGVVCSTCNFTTPDGLLACKGTGKLQATGDMNDAELEETYEEMMESLPEFTESTDITELDSNLWNWEGRSNRSVPTSFMREHLADEHGLDPVALSAMDRETLVAIHNSLHDAEVKAASSSNCPDGSCPVNASGGSCPTCPSSSSSSSSSRSSRGLFGRRR
jgi:hypothetical protein